VLYLVRAVHKFDSMLLIKRTLADGEQRKVREILNRTYVFFRQILKCGPGEGNRGMEKIT